MPPLGLMTPESSFSVVVLPAPFGPKKGHELALLDAQVDAADRFHLAVFAPEQPPIEAQSPSLF